MKATDKSQFNEFTADAKVTKRFLTQQNLTRCDQQQQQQEAEKEREGRR
jgi:hypothetical protein